MATAHDKNNENVEQLNSFLRGEMSAVETYRIALSKLAIDSPARSRLDACCQSHTERVDALRSKIVSLGGRPADSAGPWGAMTRAIETGATVFGEKMAIAALEEGEDHGLRDYREDMTKLTADARDLVSGQLLPRQEHTHRTLRDLKREIARS